MKRAYAIGVAVVLGAGVAFGGFRLFSPKPAVAQSLDTKASCDKRTVLSQCSDYAEPAFASGERFLKEPCEVLKGSFAPKACPVDALIGTCAFGAAERRHYYSTGPNAYTAQTAARECSTSEGQFHSLN